jgi:putative membrane protein
MPDGNSGGSATLPDRETISRLLSDRRAFEHSLDALVANNRFTIAVVFPLVGAVMLLASAEGLLPAVLSFNPYLVLIGVFVMRMPLIAGLAPLFDRRAGVALAALVAYTYAIEFIGATTGLPYGEFSYEVSLGPMLAGTIPYALPLFFIPLVLNSYLLCLLLLGDRARSVFVRFPVVAGAVVAIDLVLDPGAVAIGFWTYAEGTYYGVPLLNYAGWVLSAAVATALIDLAFDWAELHRRVTDCEYMLDDMVSFVLLWGGINVFYGAWLPVAIAAIFAVSLIRVDRFDFDVEPGLPGL